MTKRDTTRREWMTAHSAHEPRQPHRRMPATWPQAWHHQHARIVRRADLRRRRPARSACCARATTSPPCHGWTKAKPPVAAVTTAVTSATRCGASRGRRRQRPGASATSRWRSRPAMQASIVSTVPCCQCWPASTRLAAQGVSGETKALVVDDPPAGGMTMIRHHQRRHADAARQRPPLRGTAAQHQRIGRPQHGVQIQQHVHRVDQRPDLPRPLQLAANSAGPPAPRYPRPGSGPHRRTATAVGWRGSNRANAARLTKPKVSRPRCGVSPARSSRSSTMAPAISLPCDRASSATCGPGRAELAGGEAGNAGIAGNPVVDRRRGQLHLELRQRRLDRLAHRNALRRYISNRSARRRMKASQASSCSWATNSSGWCAWAMWPGPQTIVAMPAFW